MTPRSLADSTEKEGGARWPWQRSLQYRIAATYGLLFFVVLLLLTIWVGFLIYDIYFEAQEHDLIMTAFLAANALEDPLSGFGDEFAAHEAWEAERDESEHEDEEDDEGEERDDDEDDDDDSGGERATPLTKIPPPDANPVASSTLILPRLNQVVRTFANDTDARVTILDSRGAPLADSHFAIDQIGNQQQSAEFQKALGGVEEADDTRIDPLSGKMSLFTAAPIIQGTQLLGAVQISKPMADVMAGFARIIASLIVGALCAFLLASLLGIWIGRRLVRPVQTLESAAIAVAEGDLNQRVVATTDDELGALAHAFNYMVGELRHYIEQQQRFIANASHELRTPLTNIKLRSEALRAHSDEDPELAIRYIAEIDREADRLSRLANRLLDLSQLDSAVPQAPPDEPTNVRQVLEEVEEVMQLRAQDAGVSLKTEIPPSLSPIPVWRDQLEAAIINLVDNAIKYTPTGGQIHIGVEEDEEQVLIHIHDTGFGIPAADAPYIFDRFYRVDKVRSRQEGVGSGAGLGLSITKLLVEQNQGEIWVKSHPGGGTRFTLSFSKL